MRTNQKQLALSLLATSITLAFAINAQAAPTPANAIGPQSASTTNTPTRDNSADPGSNHQPKAQATLPTIVVTATRRRESLQNVPGGVTALTGSFLDQIHAHSFEQFAPFVPGLSYESLGPTSDLIAIRGVTTGGSQLSSGIGMYLDEVPIGASTPFGLGFQTLPINTFDLNRVEVLNGPQGTLYGANALGGAIKYVANAPNLNDFGALGDFGVSSTAHAGTNDNADAMINIPLVPGKIAIRADGIQAFDSSFGNNILLNTKDQGSARTIAGRIQVLAQINPDLSVNLTAYSQNIHGNGLNVDFRNIATGQPVFGTYQQEYSLNQPSDSSLRLYSGVINWNLHWAKLTSITAYQIDHGQYLDDLSDVYNPLLAPFFGVQAYGLFARTNTRKYTQEIRLASYRNKAFQWLIGGFYAHESTHELVNLQDGSNANGTLFGYSPFYGVLPSTYQEVSVFADGTHYFTNNFDITLGVRYSKNRQHYQQFANGLLVVPTNPALVTQENATSNQSVATYLINPRYHVSKNVMIYGKIASGYRPGGPNFVLALGHGAPTFQPDKLWNYELGEKATFLDDRIMLNADVYDINWSKIQLTVNNGGVNQIENGGSARIKGAEISAAYKMTPDLTLTGSGSYTDAKLTSAVPALGLYQPGARLPLSPKYNFALAANYNFNITNRYNGEFTVTDSYIGNRTAGYAGSLVSPVYRLPGYNTLNFDLAVFAPHGIEVDAYVNNVFDNVGQVSAATTANEYDPTAPVPVTLSMPRMIGVDLKIALGNPY
ncbi:TonB-dependent receptor, plug [mine drainage metagenome]|uniref:TonB-dependent receptor, plug n=1 Tax=mine drainage metagenome TaxID=410659 RepID=T1CG41_9ZZZZ